MCNRMACALHQLLDGDFEHPALIGRNACTSTTTAVVRTTEQSCECSEETDSTRLGWPEHRSTESSCSPIIVANNTVRRPARLSGRNGRQIRLNFFPCILIIVLYVTMSRNPAVEANPFKPTTSTTTSCIDEKLQNPCQWPVPISFKPQNDSIYEILTRMFNKTLYESKPLIDSYVEDRWDGNYKTMDSLDSEWHNVLKNAAKKALPDSRSTTIETLLAEANDRIQMSMIEFENFRRTRYPNNLPAPQIFQSLQTKYTCILCEVRTGMLMYNISHVPMTYQTNPIDVHYKLHEYIELKTFLNELEFFEETSTRLYNENKNAIK